jgi:hypothetical protein
MVLASRFWLDCGFESPAKANMAAYPAARSMIDRSIVWISRLSMACSSVMLPTYLQGQLLQQLFDNYVDIDKNVEQLL